VQQPTIAVIDDDDSIRTSLRRLLETAGYFVDTFGSAESFLEAGAADHTDCLILDLRLEGASGLQLQQELLAAARRIPTLFITSHRDTRSRQAALQAGAIDYLYKPVDTDVLLDAIQKALEDL
jgi:FixJ family two-component response regulator